MGLQIVNTVIGRIIIYYYHFRPESRYCLLHRTKALLQEMANIIVDYDDG